MTEGERIHDAPRRGVQSIARAAAVLRALADEPAGRALRDLAAAVELPKSTVHRLVGALAEEGFVDRDADGTLRLGPGLTRLTAAGQESLAARLRPILLELRRSVDETVDLAVLDENAVRFVDQVPAPRRLRATSAVGELFPLHCTANGKALLATLPEERVRALLPADLPRFTAATIVALPDLLAELEEVRQRGYALDREEHTEGICAAGAAVLDPVGAVAAISVPVPVQRFRGREADLGRCVLDAAGAASAVLSRRRR